jgi:hypothetical protein
MSAQRVVHDALTSIVGDVFEIRWKHIDQCQRGMDILVFHAHLHLSVNEVVAMRTSTHSLQVDHVPTGRPGRGRGGEKNTGHSSGTIGVRHFSLRVFGTLLSERKKNDFQ